jgi:hypothetical protein
MTEAYERYGLPFAITETSHPGIHRPNWLEFITRQCVQVIEKGIPLLGVCLYPIIDRPDWNNLSHWHHSGLWDYFPENGYEDSARVLHAPYAEALKNAQETLANSLDKYHSSLVITT